MTSIAEYTKWDYFIIINLFFYTASNNKSTLILLDGNGILKVYIVFGVGVDAPVLKLKLLFSVFFLVFSSVLILAKFI